MSRSRLHRWRKKQKRECEGSPPDRPVLYFVQYGEQRQYVRAQTAYQAWQLARLDGSPMFDQVHVERVE